MDGVLIIFLLSFSAFFSGLESALFSLNIFDRHRLRQAGGLSVVIAKTLERPREVLSTILLGNELVNVAISILVASTLYRWFHDNSRVHYLWSVGGTTLFLLIFGEIVPKNIAIRNPVLFARAFIIPYKVFSWLVTPLRVLFTKIIDLVVGLFNVSAVQNRRLIVEEEIRTLLELGQKAGTLDDFDLERNLIQNVFKFSQVRVAQVMTSRSKIVAIPIHLPLSEVYAKVQRNTFSRFPVYRENIDQMAGIFLTKNLIPHRNSLHQATTTLEDLLVPFVVVSPRQTLDEVLFRLRSQRVHMALVQEKNRVVGLLTMDDLLRRLF